MTLFSCTMHPDRVKMLADKYKHLTNDELAGQFVSTSPKDPVYLELFEEYIARVLQERKQ